MSQDQILMIKIKNVVGYLYLPSRKTGAAIIHAKGGPSLGDEGSSALWPTAKKYNHILFVPDYIGYCRSDGVFNFKNCVGTLYEAEEFLTGKTTATVCETGKRIKLSCSNLVLVGSSWGGAIVPFLEKYKKSGINNIALIKPVTDWTTQGKSNQLEEDTSMTDRDLRTGWKNIYRGYKNSEWPKIFKGEMTEYNPIDNTHLLRDKKVYVVHAKGDTAINWQKSELYYKRFKEEHPNSQVLLKIISGDHSSKMTAKGLAYVLGKIVSKRR